MNTLIKISILLLFTASLSAQAQWQPTGGPWSTGEAGVNCFASDGNNLYIGTNLGIYVSNNQGDSWQKMSIDFSKKINTLLTFNKQVFAVTDSGVYVFLEANTKWEKTFNEFIRSEETGKQIRALESQENTTTLAKDSKNIYALLSANFQLTPYYDEDPSHIFKSKMFWSADNGKNWKKFNIKIFDRDSINRIKACRNQIENLNAETNVEVHCITSTESNVVYVGTNSGIYYTADNGNNWQSLNKGLPENFTAVNILVSGNNLFLKCKIDDEIAMYFSNNHGSTWTKSRIKYAWENEYVEHDVVFNTIIYIDSVALASFSNLEALGLFKSENAGKFWQLKPELEFKVIFKGKDFVFASGTMSGRAGLFRSKDGGETWQNCAKGIDLASIEATLIHGNYLYAEYDFPKLSRYDGIKWTEIQPMDSCRGTTLLGKEYIFRIFNCGDNKRRLYRTNDDGKTWKLSNSPSVKEEFNEIKIIADSILVGTQNSGMFLSVNNGETWSAIAGTEHKKINDIYLSGKNIFYKTNAYWLDVLHKLPDTTFTKLIGDKNILYAENGTGGKYFSFDYGLTWNTLKQNLPGTGACKFYKCTDKTFAQFYNKVYVTEDEGASWNETGIEVGYDSRIITFDKTAFVISNGDVHQYHCELKKWEYLEQLRSSLEIVRTSKSVLVRSEKSLYRTKDAGKTWENIGNITPLMEYSVYDTDEGRIIDDPNNIIAKGDTLLIRNRQVIFTSTDEGETWVLKTHINEAKKNCKNNSLGILFSILPRPVVSYNNGLLWHYMALPQGSEVIDFTIKKNHFFVLTENILYHKTLKDSIWHDISNHIPDISIYFPPIISKKNIIANTSIGYFYTNNFGKKWYKMNDKLFKKDFVLSIIKNKETVFALIHGLGIFKSENFGKTWEPSNGNLPSKGVNSLSEKDGKLFAVSKTYQHDSIQFLIYISHNNGGSWQIIKDVVYAIGAADQFLIVGDAIVVGNSYSFNNGKTWKDLQIEIHNKTFIDSTVFDIIQNDTLATLVSSNDFGATWDTLKKELDQYDLTLISIGSRLYICSRGKILCSDDKGNTWKNISDTLNFPYVRFIKNVNGNLFLNTNYGDYVLFKNDSLPLPIEHGEPGAMRKMALYNGVIYAITWNSVFSSKNRGKTWSNLFTLKGAKYSNEGFNAISVSKQEIKVSSTDSVFISTDNGKTWNAPKDNNLLLPKELQPQSITSDKVLSWIKWGEQLPGRVISAGFANTFIVVSGSNGLFTSSDEGKTWTKKNPPENYQRFVVSAKNEQIFLGTDSGMFVSNDVGINWLPVVFFSGMNIYSITSSANTLLATASSDICGLHDYYTTDGITWAENIPAQLCGTLKNKQYKILNDNNESNHNLLCASTDNGKNWEPVNGIPKELNVEQTYFFNDKIFVRTDGVDSTQVQQFKVYCFDEKRKSWKAIDEFTCSSRTSMLMAGELLVAWNKNIYYSPDNGTTWKASSGIPFQKEGFGAYQVFKMETELYALNSKKIYRSDNNGISWKKIINGLNIDTIYDALKELRKIDNYIYLQTYKGIYMTSDKGENWSKVPKNFPENLSQIQSTLQSYFSGDGALRFTPNGQDNWQTIETGIRDGFIAFATDGESWFGLFQRNDIKKSNDNGNSWVDASDGVNIDDAMSNLVASKDEIFGMSSSEIYRLKYKATRWERIPNLPKGNFGFISSLNDVLYLGTSDGVFSFNRDSNSWNRFSYANCWGGGSIYSINSEYYVVDNKNNIFHSADQGKTWSLKTTDDKSSKKRRPKNYFDLHDDYTRMLNIVQHNHKLFASHTHNKRVGIACSEDTGKTWFNVGGELPFSSCSYVTNLAFCENKMFAAVSSAEGFVGEFVSEDEGLSWKLNDNGIPPNVSISNILKIDKQYLAFTSNGIYYSTDKGLTWNVKPNKELDEKNISQITLDENGKCYATIDINSKDNFWTRSVIYAADKPSADWQPIMSDTSFNERITSFISIGENLIKKAIKTSYVSPEYGPFRDLIDIYLTSYSRYFTEYVALSSDKGRTWKTVFPDSISVIAIEKHGNKLFAVTEKRRVFRSDDFGNTWQSKSKGLSNLRFNHITSVNNDVVIIDDQNNIFVSKDEGENWTCRNCLPEQNYKFYNRDYTSSSTRKYFINGDSLMLNDVSISGNIGRAITQNGIAYNSIDSGKTWFGIPKDISSLEIIAIEVQENITYLSTNGGLFASEDKGKSWKLMLDGEIAILTSSDKFVAIAKNDYYSGNEIYTSSDFGKTWKNVHNSFPEGVIALSLTIIDDTLYAGTNGKSVWKINLKY
jgi:photosystem II stability/assembly factor-like uncharacterized protein